MNRKDQKPRGRIGSDEYQIHFFVLLRHLKRVNQRRELLHLMLSKEAAHRRLYFIGVDISYVISMYVIYICT